MASTSTPLRQPDRLGTRHQALRPDLSISRPFSKESFTAVPPRYARIVPSGAKRGHHSNRTRAACRPHFATTGHGVDPRSMPWPIPHSTKCSGGQSLSPLELSHHRRERLVPAVAAFHHPGATSRPNRCGRRSRTAATRYVVDSAHDNLMRNRNSASQLGDAMRHTCSPIVANACSWPTTTPCREEPRLLIRAIEWRSRW